MKKQYAFEIVVKFEEFEDYRDVVTMAENEEEAIAAAEKAAAEEEAAENAWAEANGTKAPIVYLNSPVWDGKAHIVWENDWEGNGKHIAVI